MGIPHGATTSPSRRQFALTVQVTEFFSTGAKAMLTRRDILATAAAGTVMSAATARAASFGNPDEPAEGAVNAANSKALTDPGVAAQNPFGRQ